MMITQLNISLVSFAERTNEIDLDLNEVNRTLNQLDQFDGSVNMTDVMQVERELLALNSTVASLSRIANQSLAQLSRDLETINTSWNAIEMLNLEAREILANLTEGESMLEPILTLIDSVNVTHMELRRNLTDLDMRADRLASQLATLAERAGNVSSGSSLVNRSLVGLLEDVQRRGVEVANLFVLVQALNRSVLSLEMAASEAESRVNNLVVRKIALSITNI